MGQLTDTLRATLRDLGDTRPASNQPAVLLAGDARASREELERLSIKVLWELCKQRGITGLSKGPVPKQVDALLSHPDGPPLRSALPSKATKGSKSPAGAGKTAPKTGTAELQALEQRLDRLEQLVLLIAQQVGVAPEAITRLLPPAASPT